MVSFPVLEYAFRAYRLLGYTWHKWYYDISLGILYSKDTQRVLSKFKYLIRNRCKNQDDINGMPYTINVTPALQCVIMMAEIAQSKCSVGLKVEKHVRCPIYWNVPDINVWLSICQPCPNVYGNELKRICSYCMDNYIPHQNIINYLSMPERSFRGLMCF